MIILVTGATGFVGGHLTRRLLAQGHSVVALDYHLNPIAISGAGDRLILIAGDVSDATALRATLEAQRPEAVVHLAYLLPPETETSPARALQINLIGLHNLLEAARAVSTRRILWASSMAVYGPSHRYPTQPVDEDAPTYPTSLYGATKVMAEALARHYVMNFGLDVVGLRANLVYGPGRVRGLGEFKIWSRDLFENVTSRESVTVPFGDQHLDWIYVTDYVRAFELALRAAAPPHGVYNVLGGRRAVHEAVAAVRRFVPDARITLEPGMLPPDRQPPAFDGSRAETELGYRPELSLENGVRAYLGSLGFPVGAH